MYKLINLQVSDKFSEHMFCCFFFLLEGGKYLKAANNLFNKLTQFKMKNINNNCKHTNFFFILNKLIKTIYMIK